MSSKYNRALPAAGILALSLALSVWVVAPASAREGSVEHSSSSDSSTTSHAGSPTPTPPAMTGSNDQTETQTSTQAEPEKRAAEAKTKADALRKKFDDSANNKPPKKLDDHKLILCQEHEAIVGKLMGRLSDRGQKQLGLYTSISTRIQTFATDKKLTVAGYDTMLADIAAKKAAAVTAIDKVTADKATFKCDGTDPSGMMGLFKADMTAQSEALKSYRESIKVLMVAVKTSVAGHKATTTTPPTTPTPTPNSTPSTGGAQ